MKISEAHIAWTPAWRDAEDPTTGTVRVGTLRSNWEQHWDKPWAYTTGVCEAHWEKASAAGQERLLGILFITMTVRDQLDPRVVHRAFLAIDEYRQRMISPDTVGATDEDDNTFTDRNEWQFEGRQS